MEIESFVECNNEYCGLIALRYDPDTTTDIDVAVGAPTKPVAW